MSWEIAAMNLKLNWVGIYVADFEVSLRTERPEGCCPAFKLLEMNLRDGAYKLFPIKSIIANR